MDYEYRFDTSQTERAGGDGVKQSFYVYNNGDLKRKDNTLQFISYDGVKRDIPIERIEDIYVMSEMTFNTTFLNYISQYGIPIHFFNYYNFRHLNH